MRKATAPHPFLPSFCSICRRSAFIGRGKTYTYYCQECSEMPAKDLRKLDEWEKNALLAVDDAAGEYAAEHGTDMAAYTEEQRMLLWRVALGAWQASMTEQANGVGAPF